MKDQLDVDSGKLNLHFRQANQQPSPVKSGKVQRSVESGTPDLITTVASPTFKRGYNMIHTSMKMGDEYDIGSVRNYMAKQGKVLTENDERNIARCLENALLESGVRSKSSIFETTDSAAINFLGIQLPVISALLPSNN